MMRFFYRIIAVMGLFGIILSVNATAHQDPEIAGYVKVEGGKIWYRLNGAKNLGQKPAIIVMHGGPGGTHRGNMSYVALSDEYPVILYDQLGTGNSDKPAGRKYWTVEHFVSEITAIKNQLNLKEVIIVGHSWGGTLAAEYAVQNPEGLRGAVLSSPLISTAQWIADNHLWIKKLPQNVQDTLKKHEAAGTTDHKDYKTAESFFYSKHMCRQSPCPNRHYRRDGPNWNQDMYRYMWGPSEFYAVGTLKNYDISASLHKIKVPTLMICGEYDEAAPKSCHKFSDMIEKSRTVIVPNAGHATMSENEAFYLAAVKKYLSEIDQKYPSEIDRPPSEIDRAKDTQMSSHHKINYLEFPAKDLAATKKFFTKVFGWGFEDYGPEYSAITGAGLEGGFFKSDLISLTKNGAALTVLYSDDLEATEAAVKRAGGKIIKETFSFPGGRRFHFTEPSGNEFAVWILED